MTTPQHCPGFEQFKELESFICKCPECGEAFEIFSDEFDHEHHCRKCGQKIDFKKCEIKLAGSAHTMAAR